MDVNCDRRGSLQLGVGRGEGKKKLYFPGAVDAVDTVRCLMR